MTQRDVIESLNPEYQLAWKPRNHVEVHRALRDPEKITYAGLRTGGPQSTQVPLGVFRALVKRGILEPDPEGLRYYLKSEQRPD